MSNPQARQAGRRIGPLPLVLLLLGSAWSCASPNVGKKVNCSARTCCILKDLPQTCEIETQYMTFHCTIRKTEAPGEYVIEGTATGQGLGAFNSLLSTPMGGNRGSSFEFILIKNGITTKVIPFSVLGDNLDAPLPFQRRFKSEPFDAFVIHYFLSVRG